MKKYLFFIFIFVSFSLNGGWTRTFGGNSGDGGYSVQQTSDGGFIVTGPTDSYGAGSGDVYLIKTDADGDTSWTRTYGGGSYDWGQSVQQTAEGGYIIACYTESYGAGFSDIYLIKTDAEGDTSWTRTYGGWYFDEGYSVQQTADGGYIVAGSTSSYGSGSYDVYLIKTNTNGDTLWTRTYGGSNWDVGLSVQQTSDGGYIVAGFTESFGTGSGDVYLIKTNSDGGTSWTKTFGGGDWEKGFSVQQTSDGGYIVAGWTESYGAGYADVYLIKTNTNGDTLWTRTYGGNLEEKGYSVQQTADGGYIVAGPTESFGAGSADVYLIKTNANGDTSWTRNYGGSDWDEGRSIQQTFDGGYIVAGLTYSYGAGSADVYLIKTDENGVLVEELLITNPGVFSFSAQYISKNIVEFRFVLPQEEEVEITIYDSAGRNISTPVSGRFTQGKHDINVPVDGPGIYFYTIESESFNNSGKFIVIE